jgi:tRNA(Ile2) C34 agmatinyltransferase TiaS
VRFFFTHVRERTLENLAQRRGAIAAHRLAQIAETALLRSRENAAIGLLEAREDAHERRLTRPVRSDETDLRAVPDDARDALEDRSRAVRALQRVEPDPFHMEASFAMHASRARARGLDIAR